MDVKNMATALTSQYTRFTDKCNRVLAGGVVKTFEPYSLTPKITYQDPLATIPNLPEVTLDATGRAKIYLLGDYRIQVYSCDGVLIEDNLLVEQEVVQRDFNNLATDLQGQVDAAIATIQPTVDEAVANAGNMIGAANKAALDLITDKPVGQQAMLDNGDIYRWNGSAWISTGLNYYNYTNTRIGELINSPPVDLFTKTNKITGSYINKSGVQASSASWSCSGFLPVKFRDVLIYNATANNVVAFIAAYDINKTFLRELVSTPNSALTVLNGQKEIEADVKFIRVSFYAASSTAYSFQHKLFEFETDLLNKKETSDMVWGEITAKPNLFDPSLAKNSVALINNVETSSANWMVSDYIAVTGGGTYITNGGGYNDPVAKSGIHYYDENKAFLSYGISQTANVAFSVPVNAKFMRINYVKTVSPVIGSIVVNEGSVLVAEGRLEAKIKEVAGEGGTTERYKDKNLMTFGDSITDHYATTYTYPPIVAAHFGMNLYDAAISGTRVRSSFARAGVPTNANILASHIFTIAHGTNDFKIETPLGALTDAPTPRATLDDPNYRLNTNTTGTFYADYKGVIESILSINPNARIMLISPIRRTQPASTGTDTNSIGFKLVDYANAAKAIAEHYGLPFLDNYNTSGFNTITMPTWTTDGLHPNKWAQENVLAQKVIGFLESN